MKTINEIDQNRIDAASGLFSVILKPVGLIGSPEAIRAYLAHEAKKKPCPVCRPASRPRLFSDAGCRGTAFSKWVDWMEEAPKMTEQ